MPGLSSRGSAAAEQPLRADLELFQSASENLYHPDDNPAGALPLCIAENLLSWDTVRDKLRQIAVENVTPEWVASYTSIQGAPELRASIADFLSHHVANGASINPEGVNVTAGATATIEMTALLLGDPGDVAVIPAPTYMAYQPDVGNKAGVNVHLLKEFSGQEKAHYSTEHPLSLVDLDRAYQELGPRFRMLILTHPNNPTGQIYRPDQIRDILDWCEERSVHLIVNEIYALSLIDRQHPELLADYGDNTDAYQSVLPLLCQRNSPFFHWWYSFSKDFGISGLRVGVTYSQNETLLRAWGNYGAPSMASNHTQWLLSELLRDTNWVENMVAQSQRKLTASYLTVIRFLREHQLNYSPAAGSLFVWFDLGPFLADHTEEAAAQLWAKIYQETGVLLTAPQGSGAQPGWFRLVYSGLPQAHLALAVKRLGAWIKQQE